MFTRELFFTVIVLYAVQVTNASNNVDITNLQIVVAKENITIKCSASKNEYENDIKWIHQTADNKENQISPNETVSITNYETEFSYESNLTIKNVKNRFHGIIKCAARQLKRLIMIDDSSSLNNFGKSIQWWCFAHGISRPNVSWIKDGRPSYFHENNSRVFTQDDNLVITITDLEDEGYYACNASNGTDNVVSISNSTYTDQPENYRTPKLVLFYSVVLLILGSCIVVCLFRISKSDEDKLYFVNGAIERWNPDLGIHEQADLLPYDKRWEFPRNKLKLGERLGFGAFGVVYKAEATGIIDKNTTTIVAVKMMKLNTDRSYIKGLASELKIMIHIGKHLNIINLLGACTGNINENMMVIVEYCHFGNIHQYLLENRDRFVNQVTPDNNLDFNIQTMSISENHKTYNTAISEIYNDSGTKITSDCYIIPYETEYSYYQDNNEENGTAKELLFTYDLIYWSYQVARGMEYLASRKVLHGDLAMRNILLAEKNIIKIGDFGLAKTMYNCEYYKKKSNEDLFPVKWMAIESLRDYVFSTQSDVWSFGIVMWEMFSLSVSPYPNVFTFDDLFKRLTEGYRMDRPKYANSKLYSIMLDCWDQEPTKRPSFTDLAERLCNYLKSDTKSFYCALNEAYSKMNSERSSTTDFLGRLTSSTNINSPIASKISKNTIYKDCEHKSDDLELTSMLNK